MKSDGAGREAAYDRIAAAYELIADAGEHKARDRGLDLLAVAPGERILEIGAGTGRALVRLARETHGGAVSGLDVSSGMLRAAYQRVHRLDRVSLVRADARALPFKDQGFDAVFMSFTLELFEAADIAAVLLEARRVLRAVGRLGVVSLHQVPEPSLATEGYTWLHRHFPHFIDCRPIPVAQCVETAGFVTRRAEAMTLWGLGVMALVASPGPAVAGNAGS